MSRSGVMGHLWSARAGRIRRVLRRPDHLWRRALGEAVRRGERWLGPRRGRAFDEAALLRATHTESLEALWRRLAERPFVVPGSRFDAARYEGLCPGAAVRLAAAASRAGEREVTLLGSSQTALGHPIDWHRDFKAGRRWPTGYGRDLTLAYRQDTSDVKVPWELSRLQWLLPVAQAYLLGLPVPAGESPAQASQGEALAAAARDVLEEWIEANPYAQSVNWAVAMEAALRVLSWSFLFHAFAGSEAWANAGFRGRFLRTLYLHGDFVERHFEESPVNGNHFTADAAGLVFAGLFFGNGEAPRRWLRVGWQRLVAELPKQVFADGVDFEASTAYHRLVMELFLLAALYRSACGFEVPAAYRERLVAMAHFVATYTRPDGLAPLWGDADDARALPLGGQDVDDHRYLVGLVAEGFDVPELREAFSGSLDEVFWLLGPEAAERLATYAQGQARATGAPGPASQLLRSRRFPDGGVFVMRSALDHVFIDCGPVGLAGRGGHGHNDCLSFEAYLNGVPLVSDCGTYLYSADLAERDRFRSSRSHNAPIVDGVESNRLDLGPWFFRDDAHPELRRFEPGDALDVFVGAHSGYRRLPEPVTPVRTLVLDRRWHGMVVRDAFEGRGRPRLEVPLHLAPGVQVELRADDRLQLVASGRTFLLVWEPAAAWRLEQEAGRVSPSYGVALPCVRLAWRREGPLHVPLTVCLLPATDATADPLAWARELLAEVGVG